MTAGISRRQRRIEIALTTWALAAFAVTWAGFAMAVTANPGLPAALWEWFVGQPIPVQAFVGVLVLPGVVGLWAWQVDFGVLAPIGVGLILAVWTVAALRNAWRLRHG